MMREAMNDESSSLPATRIEDYYEVFVIITTHFVAVFFSFCN